MSDTLLPPRRVAVVLLAKSAVSASPLKEMQGLAAIVESLAPGVQAFPAYSEQGTPSLRDVLLDARERGFEDVRIIPLLLPMEPAFPIWIRKVVARWQAEMPGNWPIVRLAGGPSAQVEAMSVLLGGLLQDAASGETLAPPDKPKLEGSLVPAQKHRVLVCAGGPCNDAGSAVIWGHLRNEQERQKLRTAGDGMMSAKSTCLGPCNLAPVVQVWPDGTNYGGVDEAGIDRIIAEHLLGGRVVEDLAYVATGRKQEKRQPSMVKLPRPAP